MKAVSLAMFAVLFIDFPSKYVYLNLTYICPCGHTSHGTLLKWKIIKPIARKFIRISTNIAKFQSAKKYSANN